MKKQSVPLLQATATLLYSVQINILEGECEDSLSSFC